VLPITEDVAPSPLETYAASKYMQELCFRGFDNCPATIFRFSSVYGPRLRLDDGEATIIAKLAGWIRGGVSPKLFEDGRQVRDWVHVGDVACAVEAVAAGAAPPPVVNVCSGVPTTLQEACAVLSGVMGVDVPPQIIGGYRPGDMRACLGDTTRLAALLGRAPRPFREGAALTFGDRPSRQLG
jgi:dTDP-L-rhamnose 4-epimerase